MKRFFALSLVPTFVWSARIPLDIFDQSKLEALLRSIPSAFVKNEEQTGYVRKHYQFPKNKSSSFVINCQADYFNSAPVPSFKACQVEVTSKDIAGEEIRVQTTEASVVGALYSAISYGSEVKKFIATERVYGQASDGSYKNLFRYSFSCKLDSCEIVFVAKEANL